MAKGAYIGVDGIARKIKKGYIGVDDVARKIKKAYIGIGGVARPFWGGGLEYYGQITPLSAYMANHTATTVGNYGIFADHQCTDAYSSTLTKSTAATLSQPRYRLAATAIGSYALFGGGTYESSYNTVDAYNTSLTKSTPTTLSAARSDLAATSVGNYALFGGGNQGTSAYYNTVDAYNTSLTRSTPTVLSVARGSLAATTIGEYALFGGGRAYINGYSREVYDTVDAYNTSLTRSIPSSLRISSCDLAATTVGNYGLFAGGSYRSTVTAYNTSLTRSDPNDLNSADSEYLAATAVGNYALFAGGRSANSGYAIDEVNVYDTSLTKSMSTSLSAPRYSIAATTVGNYALFSGGANKVITENYQSEIYYWNSVDVYTVT